MEEKEKIFEEVYQANLRYYEAVKSKAGATRQKSLLRICNRMMRERILDAGLATEYREWAEKR